MYVYIYNSDILVSSHVLVQCEMVPQCFLALSQVVAVTYAGISEYDQGF